MRRRASSFDWEGSFPRCSAGAERARRAALAVALAGFAPACGGESGSGAGAGSSGSGGSPSSASSTSSTSSTSQGGGGADSTSISGAASSADASTAAGTGGSPDATSSAATGGAGGGACNEDPCKLTSPQCGCDAQSACTLGENGPLCVPAGTKKEAELCSGSEPCEPGLICITAEKTTSCRRYCDLDADCLAPGGLCISTLSFNGQVADQLICTNNCDPLTSAGCPQGLACQIYQEPAGQKRYYTFCRQPGAGGSGAPCAAPNDCKSGYVCTFSAPGSGTCLQVCDTAAAQCETAGVTCKAGAYPEKLGGKTYGRCSP